MSTLRTALLTAAAGLGALVLVLLVVIWSGVYNVAATEPHTDVVRRALNALQRNSVSDRAGTVEGAVPTDAAALDHGFRHFDAMCVQCHGAPGVERGELGRGITPTPPELSEVGPEWSDAELFWITKHGIKLAGMPAFGPTHSDEDIWSIVGAVRRVQRMSPEEYRMRIEAVRRAGGAASDTARGDTHGGPGHTH